MPSRHDLRLSRLEPLEQRRLLSAGDLDAAFGVGGRVHQEIGRLELGGEILVLSDD